MCTLQCNATEIDRSVKPLTVAMAQIVSTFIFMVLQWLTPETNMEQVSSIECVIKKIDPPKNLFVCFKAVTFSFYCNIVHGLVTPTHMIWTSTEYAEACRSFLVNICSTCFSMMKQANENEAALSKREKALAQARLATEWRNQQPCRAKNSMLVPAARPLQPRNVDSILSSLTTRSGQRREDHENTVEGQSISIVSRTTTTDQLLRKSLESVSTVIKVTPIAGNASRESEVMLKCSNLNLIAKVDDPVDRIGSFQRPKLTFHYISWYLAQSKAARNVVMDDHESSSDEKC